MQHEPGSAGRASSRNAESALSDSMTTFKTLLWTGYALAVLGFGFQMARMKEEDISGYLIVAVLLLGSAAWFNVMLTRGRNWARMAFTVLMLVSVPAIFFEWPKQSGAEISIGLVSVGLSVWLLKIMFTDPIKAIFLEPRSARK